MPRPGRGGGMTPAPPKPKEGPGQPRMTEQGGSLRQSGMDGRSPRKRQEQALRWRTVQEPAPGRHKDRRLGRPQKEAAGSSSPNPARAALRGTEDDLDLPAPGKEDPRVSFPAKALLLPTGAQAVAASASLHPAKPGTCGVPQNSMFQLVWVVVQDSGMSLPRDIRSLCNAFAVRRAPKGLKG